MRGLFEIGKLPTNELHDQIEYLASIGTLYAAGIHHWSGELGLFSGMRQFCNLCTILWNIIM